MARGAPRRTRGADPGSLLLFGPAPVLLPAPIAPEAAIVCSGPFDNQGWRFTVDWEGVRTLLITAPDGSVRLFDERRRDITGRFPEVTAAAVALGRRSAVLDGVIAVVDADGRPDLPALCRRMRGGPPPPAAVYLATDLLHLDGTSTTAWALDRRQQALTVLVPPSSTLQLPGSVIGQGGAFCAAAAEHGLAAVLARRGDAPYRPGMASPHRLRIALAERADAVVVGLIRAAAPTRARGSARQVTAAAILGEWLDGRLVDAGRAGLSCPADLEAWLTERITELTVPSPPWEGGSLGEEVSWLRPELVATVSHHGRDESGRLRLAAVEVIRDDRDPVWCIRRELVAAPAEAEVEVGEAARFRPTVLRTLPLDD